MGSLACACHQGLQWFYIVVELEGRKALFTRYVHGGKAAMIIKVRALHFWAYFSCAKGCAISSPMKCSVAGTTSFNFKLSSAQKEWCPLHLESIPGFARGCQQLRPLVASLMDVAACRVQVERLVGAGWSFMKRYLLPGCLEQKPEITVGWCLY